MTKHVTLAFVFLAWAAALSPGVGGGATVAQRVTYDPALRPGVEPFPIRATALDGRPVALSDYRGKVLLIDFWATWCPPCRAELPYLTRVYEKYRADGFEVLSISLDDEATRQNVPAFIQQHRMNWRHICDGRGWETPVARRYGVRAIPLTVLVGRDGKIVAVNVRGRAIEPSVRAALAAR